jgi:deoxycytidine triphosphate deaminase
MGALGVDKIKKFIKDIKLVENLGTRDLENPEGAGLDLRLGEIFKIEGETFLGEETRKTVTHTSVAKYDPKKTTSFTIKPGEFYLVQTIENINLPDYLVATFHPRSTLLRSGVWLLTTQAAPGYRGPLNFGLKNMGNCEVKIELGARIVHIIFWEVSGKGAAYRGQWQGGRVTTEKEEKQV